MSDTKFDVCVIGAGPGGYVCAINAAKNGAKVALVEKSYLGGTCLNVGCIPTKTLVAGAEALHTAKHAAEFGIKITGKVEPDWAAMQQRKGEIIKKLSGGIAGLLKAAGVQVFNGAAEFKSRTEIAVKLSEGGNVTLQAAKTVIATGSKPARPGFVPEGKRILDSTSLLALEKLPASLLVLGGGYIGCEFACLFAELGVKVTVAEALPEILATQDQDIFKFVGREMKKNGIEIMTGKPLTNIKSGAKSVSGTVDGKEVSAEYLLVSVGRVPVTEGLNLKAAGVSCNERGFIPVDDRCATNVPGVYAIGDVTGRMMLAHMASAMAAAAADNVCGKKAKFSDKIVPGCVFTMPEIGSVGLTEQQCVERGLKFHVGKFNFAGLGKAMAINDTVGFCKIIADVETDQILGVHIVGPHATDLISEAVTAMALESTAAALGNAIHAHPTLGEVMMEAAHDVHGKSAHVPAKRR